MELIHELPPGAPLDDLELELVDRQHLQATLTMTQSYDASLLTVGLELNSPWLSCQLVFAHHSAAS
jgi:hypothetical protein